MSGIKYYQLSKDEELPDEFCAVKDIGGEPSEYTFYVPEAENAKLRELVKRTWLFANRAHEAAYELCPDRSDPHALATISALTLNAQDVAVRMRELGIEVPR